MRLQALAILLLAVPAAADDRTAPSPGVPWIARAGSRPTPTPRPAPNLPAEWLRDGKRVTLSEAIDLALRNSPVTRVAWYQARSAAAEVGIKEAAYYPAVSLDANLTRQKLTSLGGSSTTLLTTYGAAAGLSYLLLDLGGRAGDLDEARQALEAANFTQNAVLQNVILDVERAYYQYQEAKALLVAATASVKEAETNLEAADQRHKAGVATIADVLQARTARSQAQLSLETAEGRIQTIRGALATTLGVPASVPIDVVDLPAEVAAAEIGEAVESFIDKAVATRPELDAARAAALKAEGHVRSVRSSGLPTLSLNASVSRTWYVDSAFAPHGDNYSGALLIHFPVFTGFANTYDLRKAKEDADAARALAETSEQQVVLEVFTSYYALRTAAQRVKTAHDLLASATESEEVAAGRYKEGVGSILDLLTAQSALENARAQEAQARADWLIAAAQLAHDSGALTKEAP